MADATDDFNRANAGTLGANWTTGTGAGTYSVDTNQAIGATGGRNTVFWSADDFEDDQYAEFDVVTGNFNYGPVVRHDPADDSCYYIFYDNSIMAIWRMLNGAFTKLSADHACGSLTTGATLRLEVAGDALTMFLDGIEVGDATDSNLTGGYPGIFGTGAGRVDNWLGGPIADTTAPVLSDASATATGETTADLAVDTDEGNGTLYWVVTTSSSQPSAAQIVAGQDHTGAAAADSGNQAVVGTGEQTANASGLTEGTAYWAYFVQDDDAANRSNIVSDSFVTDSASVPATPISASEISGGGGRRRGRRFPYPNVIDDGWDVVAPPAMPEKPAEPPSKPVEAKEAKPASEAGAEPKRPVGLSVPRQTALPARAVKVVVSQASVDPLPSSPLQDDEEDLIILRTFLPRMFKEDDE